jgi:hypothetical protein
MRCTKCNAKLDDGAKFCAEYAAAVKKIGFCHFAKEGNYGH